MIEEEKLAEEWIKEHSGLIGSYKFVKYDYDSLKQAFLAGLKAGRPKWHDLQKAPNDLPPKIKGMCISKYVLSENGTLVYYDYKNKMFATYMIVPTEVIAWCEIPKYTEE